MKRYNISEIFYSLQGEGSGTGEPSFFIRFFGCNRACPFCDTKLARWEQLTCEDMFERIKEIAKKADIAEDNRYWRFVLTGGEPTLQIDEDLVSSLLGCFGSGSAPKIQIETNGTRLEQLPLDILSRVYLAISPKTLEDALSVAEWLRNGSAELCKGAEIKLVSNPLYPEDSDLSKTLAIFKDTPEKIGYFLQPLDTGNKEQNIEEVKKCVQTIKTNPKWRLSLQTHKILNIR